jgi:uncharacterized FlaG/YvyC family protein
MNISPIESKMVEFIKRPENVEKVNKVNNKLEKSKLEDAPKQNRLENSSSNNGDQVKQEESLMNMIKKVLEELDVNNIDINVGFKMRDDFKEPIIEVVDKDTKKVIRQIPTEEFITRVNNSDNLKGMLFDDKF